MYFDYFNALVFSAVGFVFVFANMAIGSVIRPKRKGEQGLEVYECGEEALGEAWVKFDIRYYTVALVYVIFAVEIAFLFPWAIVLKESFAGTGAAEGLGIGAFALVEGVLFIVVLFLGLAYVWAKGDLDWVLAYQGGDYAGRTDRSRKVPSLEEIRAAAEGKGDEAGEASGDHGEEALA